MNTLLILLIGYCAGRSDHFHKTAKQIRDDFMSGFNAGLKQERRKK